MTVMSLLKYYTVSQKRPTYGLL